VIDVRTQPRVCVVDDADGLNRTGADLVAEVISTTPSASVVAATGRTPMGLYDELAARRRAGLVDASGITAYQLDEYLGLEANDRRSLLGWMQRSIVDPLGIPDERVIALPLDGDIARRCAAFDDDLDARGGLDLAILGLGPNGHLGFNEPPSRSNSPTREVALSPATIQANAAYWGDIADVPATAVTMGLGTLLRARSIVVVVSGGGKHAILRRTLDGAIGPDVPASFLRAVEGDVTVVADRAAWEGP
jgi:glucosamine-6-phosphate deaminase